MMDMMCVLREDKRGVNGDSEGAIGVMVVVGKSDAGRLPRWSANEMVSCAEGGDCRGISLSAW